MNRARDEPEPQDFVVAVETDKLDDLRRRLLATRWPKDVDDDSYYGTPTSYLRDLVKYWIDDFDWARAERHMNEFTHYRADVDGVGIHFIREEGVGPAPVPIILSHGWPWSFWDLHKVIRPLADPGSFGGDPADAFEVIVPSLPGFGFSTPINRPDMNFWKTADLWNTLMTQNLGFKRYAAGGADFGALVSGQLGHKYSENLYGIWLGQPIHLDIFSGERPWDVTEYTGGTQLPDSIQGETRKQMLAYRERLASHVAVHMLDPQDLSYGLSDSPVGMLAWMLRRWTTWSDSGGDVESVFPRDHLLTNATIWWVTESITTSIRSYVNIRRYPWVPSHDRLPIVQAPMGVTFLGGENPPGLSTDQRVDSFLKRPGQLDWYNPVYMKAHEKGGHFVMWENPEATIEDIRATFRGLRSNGGRSGSV